MPTRWNSVVMSIKTVVRITPALKKIREKDLELFRGKIPSVKELDSYAELLAPLLMIKEISEQLEADKTPTMHLALPLICKLGTFSRSKNFTTSSKTTKAVVEAFEAGLQTRMKDYGKLVQLYRFGNILHPTFKGSLLNFDGDDFSYNRTLDEIKALFPEVQPLSQSQDSQALVSISSKLMTPLNLIVCGT